MAICSAVTSKVRLFQAYRTASSASAAVHTPKKKRSGIYLLLLLLSVGFYLWHNGNVDFSHTTYDHATQASDVIRQALLNHEEKVSFRYRTDRYDKSLLSTALSPTSQEIRAAYYAAVEHTGRPNEGDQLSRWTYLSEIMTTAYPQLNGTYIIQADCKIGYYVTKEQEAWLRTRIPAILSSLNLTGKSDYEKVRAIYNWICSHVLRQSYPLQGALSSEL